MKDALATLRQQIFSVSAIDEDAWDALSSAWTPVSFKRKQLITRAGDTEKYLYVVLEGVQRAFYVHADRDATLVFSYAPSFSGVIDSFFLQQPSRFSLETLTSSRLLRIHFNDLSALMEMHRTIETWVRLALTHTLAGTLVRQTELLAFSAEERFRTLLQRSPHVLQIIPHKYLASYIGVDPATFSKLMGTVRI